MKTKILSSLRRDGYKAGMIMMLIALSTMMLTTACSNEDDALNNTANTENTINKGYALPVTVNVTRGDGATRASYNESTRKLEFSDGDKLFVEGSHIDADRFAGTLTWQSGGTFSGTIYTESPYEGTIDDLLNGNYATLLPAGYDSYNFLSIDDQGTSEKYDDEVSISRANAFVASATAKKTGVELLSWEQAYTYSSGFALAPRYAVLNFTITGLTAVAQDVTLQVTDGTNGNSYSVTGSVTPNASGVATFAVGVPDYTNIKDVANNLTIGSSNFTLPSNINFDAGKIYNITRGTGATVDLSTKNTAYTAQNGETLTGTLTNNVQISIADGAMVILHNVNINGSGTWTTGSYAGITCNGDATIILSGTNNVKGFNEDYPGIYVPENMTVTIQGTGSLNASSNGSGAGIGGGNGFACGNITINGGNITATGGIGRAGIGSGTEACGNITITGGTITATGGNAAAGIGGGNTGDCGDITITSGVTRVTATKGNNISPNSIGAGAYGTCGTVTIGGTEYWDGSAYKNGGDTYLTTSPLTYPAPAPSYTMAAAATTSDKGKLICTAGHIHVYGEDAACTAGRVAKIIYVGTTGHATYNHGLALALTDENGGSTMNWSAAGSACSNKNTSTPVTGATWLLASQDQWNTMITAFGGYGDLRDGFSSIGGTNLQTTYRYWSSSDSGDLGYRCSFYDGSWGLSDKGNPNYARAALAF